MSDYSHPSRLNADPVCIGESVTTEIKTGDYNTLFLARDKVLMYGMQIPQRAAASPATVG